MPIDRRGESTHGPIMTHVSPTWENRPYFPLTATLFRRDRRGSGNPIDEDKLDFHCGIKR
jgi:hypothetical protein